MKHTFLIFFTLILAMTNPLKAQGQNNDNERIKDLIEKKRQYNKENGYGYRIQLFNGEESKARQIRAKFSVEFNAVKTYLKYQTPEWKVQVGNFKTKLEADRALLKYRDKFSSAIVIPLKK